MNKNITAVIVTHNRLELLKRVISSVKKQTYPVSGIIIVNNDSSDGTEEWLNEQDGISIINQANTGSSGGQFTGFNAAFERGAEWIWAMDDDVFHRPDCLENLVNGINENRIHAPLRHNPDGSVFYNDTLVFNLTNPFKGLWVKIISPEDLDSELISATGLTFEGPLFHRSLIEKTGLPEKKFFIFADDTEYFIRAQKNGFQPYIVRNAKSDRAYEGPPYGVYSWKTYYAFRNIIAIDVLHTDLLVRIIRPIVYLISWLRDAKNREERRITLKAFKDGYFYKSEN